MVAKVISLNRTSADPGTSSFAQLLRQEGDQVRRDVFSLLAREDTTSRRIVAGYTVVYPGCTTNGHAHSDREEIYHFARGRGVMIVDGSETAVAEGDTLYLPPGPFHTARNPSALPLEYFWVTIECGG